MTDHFDGDDYNLRVLIERMQRMRSSEREIEVAVREASGCLSHRGQPALDGTAAPAVPGDRTATQGRDRLWKREEGQR